MAHEKQNKLFGICASLGLHGLAAAILIFSLSESAMIPQNIGKLNFVWVSLAAKDKHSFSPAAENRRQKIQSMAARTEPAPAISATQNLREEPETIDHSPEISTSGKTTAVSESKSIAYASSSYHLFSGTGQAASSGRVLPGYSDLSPLYRKNPPPIYPETAKLRGYEGTVWVSAEILPDGSVGDAKIMKTSDYAILDQSALDAVKRWKFEPARKAGEPYTKRVEIPIRFKIYDTSQQS